uniref:Uncharacterized protein n=1 Tax=Setaria viridis TaxID=4556 RepID=A0A4U6TNY1_SETVI|nr:hypothetical protein SEVIR_7G050900v2 [Setaria viridis]
MPVSTSYNDLCDEVKHAGWMATSAEGWRRQAQWAARLGPQLWWKSQLPACLHKDEEDRLDKHLLLLQNMSHFILFLCNKLAGTKVR